MAGVVSDPDKKLLETKDNVATPEHPSESNLSTDDTETQRSGHYGSTDDHIFADPATADYWRLKYEKAGYENRHRFDPALTWTADEEKKIVRKVRQAGSS
jgi:hypothetical protein